MQLKGDVLSYYVDPSKIYYPSGQIDLRLGITANLADHKDKNNSHFSLTTDKREYLFRADNPSSARDWVKMLQKVIFRSHNDGDSVKISLPVENVMDIEDCQVLDFADTVKIRVIDNDETYAIDEVSDYRLAALKPQTLPDKGRNCHFLVSTGTEMVYQVRWIRARIPSID